jgi:phosphoserine phosphatase
MLEETGMQTHGDPLPSWNDGAARQAITVFVESVTTRDRPDYVPPAARVAVFDNDGTLWCEKPLPVQADFLLRRVGEMAQQDPSLRDRQPWKAVVEKDHAWLSGVITKHYHGDDSDLQVMAGGLLAAYEGSTIEEFEQIASAFMHTARHPTLDRTYLACAYRPMVELLRYLEANGFTNYIASGGGRDFMRTISQECYGIPPERVIGSSVALEYREVGGAGQIVHTAKPDLFDDGPAKPVRIWSRTGRRPILAGGNSNGDVPMLEFAGGPSRPALRLLVLHDDAEREFDYVTGAEQALERAQDRGWTVVSVKQDWRAVFAPADRPAS